MVPFTYKYTQVVQLPVTKQFSYDESKNLLFTTSFSFGYSIPYGFSYSAYPYNGKKLYSSILCADNSGYFLSYSIENL